MEKVINPKTNKPYTQTELQTAYEAGNSLPFVLDTIPGIGNIYGLHFVSKVWIDESGHSKEVYI